MISDAKQYESAVKAEVRALQAVQTAHREPVTKEDLMQISARLIKVLTLVHQAMERMCER